MREWVSTKLFQHRQFHSRHMKIPSMSVAVAVTVLWIEIHCQTCTLCMYSRNVRSFFHPTSYACLIITT